MTPPKMDVFVSFAAADAALVAPLLAQLEALQAQHGYFFFEAQRHGGGDAENARFLGECDELVMVVSRAYLRDPFYRRFLRDRPKLRQEKRVRLLWVQSLVITNEPLLHLVAPPVDERIGLADLQQKGQLEAYYDDLVDGWTGAAWRQFRNASREQAAALVEQQRVLEEASRRRALRGALASAAGLAIFLFVVFAVDLPSSPSRNSPYFTERDQPLPGEEAPELRAQAPDPAGEDINDPLPDPAPPARIENAESTPVKIVKGEPSRYERHHRVGHDRLVALLNGRLGWQLLDANWMPVTEQRFRRVYFKEGFQNGKMKVKAGEEEFYIDRYGKRVE